MLKVFYSESHGRTGIQNHRLSPLTYHDFTNGYFKSATLNESPRVFVEAEFNSSFSLNAQSRARSQANMPREEERLYSAQIDNLMSQKN